MVGLIVRSTDSRWSTRACSTSPPTAPRWRSTPRPGKQLWKTKVEYPPETPRIVCCGIINRRGAAIYDGKIFRTTLDANVIALDAKTSKELFARTRSTSRPDPSSTAGIPRGVSICGAPSRSPDRASPAVTPSRETPGRMGAARPGSPARSIPSCTPVLGHRQSGSVQRHRQGRATISTPVQCWRSIPRRER